MPIFSYICKDCGEKFDLLIGVTAESEELECRRCHGRNIHKTFAPFAVSVSSGTLSSEPVCPPGACSEGSCSNTACPLGQ